jgi:subtilisin family serine protease
VDYATHRGVVVVAAAGNDGIDLDTDPPSLLMIPAQLDHVISVGATAPFNEQNFDALARYSNFGSRTGIALVAPGGDLPTGGSILDLVLGACSHTEVTLAFQCQTNYVLSGSGTSFASPHVAGAAAVVGSRLGRQASSFRITRCLLEGADPAGPREIVGAGRLNVARAAACQSGPHPHHAHTHH